MKRLIAAGAAAILMLLAVPAAPAWAVADSEKRCTQPFYEYDPNPQICIRLWYEDNGASVTLQKMTAWMVNPRTMCGGCENQGYKLADMYVKCNRNDGTTDWFIHPVGDITINDDRDVYTFNPTNMNCSESNVVFGGIGILRIYNAPDRQDDFGSGNNYLTND